MYMTAYSKVGGQEHGMQKQYRKMAFANSVVLWAGRTCTSLQPLSDNVGLIRVMIPSGEWDRTARFSRRLISHGLQISLKSTLWQA